MADEPAVQQPISDDQELAKVLAGVSQDADTAVAAQAPVPEESVVPAPEPVVAPVMSSATDDLSGIKLEAINELRPLVDKLDVSPEEKFDIYLLLLRSTDDKELIAPAHEAAKLIADESRRAQALLDVIKEIDFLNQNQK
jgi:hypothetical protein